LSISCEGDFKREEFTAVERVQDRKPKKLDFMLCCKITITYKTYFVILVFQEFVKQLQLSELVVARAHSLRFKFQDALSDNGSEGADKDVEHFLSALMEKPEVTVIGAGRGPAGRVIHSLFAKQEVCAVICFATLFSELESY